MGEEDVVAGVIEMAGVAAAGAAMHQTSVADHPPTLPCRVQSEKKLRRRMVMSRASVSVSVGMKLWNGPLLGDSPTGMLNWAVAPLSQVSSRNRYEIRTIDTHNATN